MAAMRADLQVRDKVPVEDHLLAGRALVPEVLRHLAPREQGADLRADEFAQPAHALSPAHGRGQRPQVLVQGRDLSLGGLNLGGAAFERLGGPLEVAAVALLALAAVALAGYLLKAAREVRTG